MSSPRCTANCARTEKKTYGASTDAGGRRGERRCSGREPETKRKNSAVARPVAVAWVSPMRTPRKCST